MADHRSYTVQLRQLDTPFWMASALSVPVMLAAAVLSSLFLEMAVVGAGAETPAARLIAVGIVGLSLAVLSVWLVRKLSGTPRGVAVPSLIAVVFVVIAGVSTG